MLAMFSYSRQSCNIPSFHICTVKHVCTYFLLSRTTLQSLYQATENARQNNYYVGGLSHTWMTFYQSQLTEDYLIRNEWYVHVYTLYMYM